MMNKNIPEVDKKKLVLVHDMEDHIVDEPLETKEIGYYRDSWNRFKKNRASLVAFVIICIMFFFILFGPYMKKYTIYGTGKTEIDRLKLANLTPKMPGLKNIGIFTGNKKITRGRRFLLEMNSNEHGEGIIISGIPEELLEDPNHPDYEGVTELTVKVDYYRYVNYVKSYMPESYFGDVDQNIKSGNQKQDPLAPVKVKLLEEDFKDALARNIIIDVLDVTYTVNSDGEKVYTYVVRLNQFAYLLGQDAENTHFWFGTTSEGKDLFTELWKGARVSLLMALSVLIVNTIVGLTIGSIVGYYGGILDLIFDRFVEILSSIPFLSVLTLLTIRFGSALWVILLAFTVTGWLGAYGTGRMQFYRFKNREYVLAARTLGASDARIMAKHIFPNTLGYIVTGYALAIPAFVFSEASYSFLGIINYADTTSVGMLLKQGQDAMHSFSHLLIVPSLYIAILMIAFNLFGNGLRDAFNPAMRGAE